MKPLILGISGASGLIYAVRALKFLLEAEYHIELVASKASYMVWQAEQNIRMPPEPEQQEQFWSFQQSDFTPSLGSVSPASLRSLEIVFSSFQQSDFTPSLGGLILNPAPSIAYKNDLRGIEKFC